MKIKWLAVLLNAMWRFCCWRWKCCECSALISLCSSSINISVELLCAQTLKEIQNPEVVTETLSVVIVRSLAVPGINDATVTSSLCILFAGVVSVLLDSRDINYFLRWNWLGMPLHRLRVMYWYLGWLPNFFLAMMNGKEFVGRGNKRI
jgi:hypothetical protein